MANPVFVCTWGVGRDGVAPGSGEVLSLAREVAASAGSDLIWLIVGPAPDGAAEFAARFRVARLERLVDPHLERFGADAYVEAIGRHLKTRQPRACLFPQTFDARLVAPRVAARIDAGVVMNAVACAAGEDGALEVTASAYGGDTRVTYVVGAGGPNVIGVLTDVLLAEPGEAAVAPEMEELGVDLSAVQERVRVVEEAHTEGPRLEEAQIIVAGGRGLGEKENFRLVEELAEALGGMSGASRPIVDDGWIDSSRQVGLTGKITRPALYVAAGISGASQHMAGCSAAKTLVGINTDPEAAIFRYARYGIVGDCLEVLPALTRAVKGA